MPRIDLPEGEGLDVAKALMAAPHWVPVVLGYEEAVAKSTLDPRLHELVRYRVAQLNQCTLCLATRREGSGVTEADLAAVGVAHEGFTALEQAALEFTERFSLDNGSISDDLLQALQASLGPAGVVDLALVVGKYVAMGRFMQVLGLDQTCAVPLHAPA